MSRRKDLYDLCMERQDGICPISGDPLSDDPYLNQLDRFPIPGRDGGKYVEDNVRVIHLACDWQQEGNAPSSPEPMIAARYREYKLWQTEEGRYDRKIRAYTGDLRGTTRSPYSTAGQLIRLEDSMETAGERTKAAAKSLKEEVKKHPLSEPLLAAPGMGPILLGYLLSKIDIGRAEYPSSLWKMFGLVPGQQRGAKGRNPGLGKARAPFYAALSIFLKRKTGPYRADYDRLRERGLGDAQTVQRLIKLWLSHLWLTWRQLSGLSITEPYAANHLGHDMPQPPTNYGWPQV